MDETHFAINIFIILLLIASSVAMITKWIRVPYTLALVIIGLTISPMHFLPTVHISPELILLIFLPALLFDAAWNLKLNHLRENWIPIVTFATLGVGLSVAIIGGILHFSIGLPLPTAFLFGAMISGTDPVSVLAIFKQLGLPGRLTTIVEGESLFNDGTSVVVFKIIAGIVAGATMGSPDQLLGSSFREFGLVVFGGIAVGATIGILASTLTSYFDDHLLEITLTTISAYGSFLLSEGIHVSPVIAVLITGLILGNFGRRRGMSPTTQVAVNSFWEYAAFVVNSLVFLLIGLEIQVPTLAQHIPSIAWAILATLVARAVVVYTISPLTNLSAARVPIGWQHVLFWGGLRGSLSIALVLSLPTSLVGRSQLVVMIFGSVLFSLLLQGLTIEPLLKWLKITQKEPRFREYELLQGRLMAETAAAADLESLRSRGLVTEATYQSLWKNLSASQKELGNQLDEFDEFDRKYKHQRLSRLRHHLIQVKKARLAELIREGLLSESTQHALNQSFDEELAALQGEGSPADAELESKSPPQPED